MNNLNREQPAPKIDATGEDCWLGVIEQMRQRRLLGLDRYGVPVRADNGRDSLVDAFQEVLDLAVYLYAAIQQQAELVRLRQENEALRRDVVDLRAANDELRRLVVENERAEADGE